MSRFEIWALLFLSFSIGVTAGYAWHVKASQNHEEMTEFADPCKGMYTQSFVDSLAGYYETREQARILQRRIDAGELPHPEEIKEAMNGNNN